MVPDARPLIVGGDGLVGSAVVETFERAASPFWATTRRQPSNRPDRLYLDLAENVEGWRAPGAISTVLLCAGETSIERCRQDPAGTARINVEGSIEMARRFAAEGARVLFLSTNLVFDGAKPRMRPTDSPNPRTEYGRQKVAVERAVLGLGRLGTVVRLTKVLGRPYPLFSRWRCSLEAGEPIHPFSDMVFSPVSVRFVADALYRIAHLDVSGIVQISGPDDVSYADVARHVGTRLGARQDLIQPVLARDSRLPPEVTPPHTTLDTGRLTGELGMNVPLLWSTIDEAWAT